MSNGTGNENQALIDEVKKFNEVQILKVENADDELPRYILSIPHGRQIQSAKAFLDEYLLRPERVKGTASLTTLTSFIEHVNRFKGKNSAVFADVSNQQAPKLVAVIDYHDGGQDGADWCQHRAVYEFPLSAEWVAWRSKERNAQIGQQEFAEFLEDRIVDVMHPETAGETVRLFATDLGLTLASPQRLLELSRGLTVRVGAKVVQSTNLSTGEMQIAFEEKHDGEGGPLKIPGAFAVGIPVFRNGPVYSIPVRLKYRVTAGSVTWGFSLQRIEKVWDHAVEEVCNEAREKTGLPLFFGKPEV